MTNIIRMFDKIDTLGIKCIIDFNTVDRNYTVTVSYKDTVLSKSFLSFYDPIYGIDVVDRQQAMEIAEEFAHEIETKYTLL